MSDQEKPAAESRGIEVRVIGGGAPAGWEPVEEEVVRLVKSGVAGARTVEEMKSSAGEVNPVRGSGTKWTLGKWTLIMAGGVGLLVVGAVVALERLREKDSRRPAPFDGVEVAYAVGEDPDDPFLKRADAYLDQAREELAKLAAADPSEVASMTRRGAELRPLLEEQWKPLALDEARIDRLSLEIREDDSGRESVLLTGRDDPGDDLRLVFVPENGELVFDWAASVGANRPDLGEFRESATGEEADFRVEARVDHYHGSRFPEEQFRCFRLADVFSDEVAWAYAPRGSEVAEAVASALGVGSEIVGQEEETRLILRLRNTGRADRGQFELIRLVAADWIRWEDE